MARRRGRGRLSNIDLLPEECEAAIVKAASKLRARELTQNQIYKEFRIDLEEVIDEHNGALDFEIPSRSSFSRYSLNKATLSRRLEEGKDIAEALSKSFDDKSSDDLTNIATEMMKTLLVEMLMSYDNGGIDPKGAMQLSNALRTIMQIENISPKRAAEATQDLADKTDAALIEVQKRTGLSAKMAQELRVKLLGVRPAPEVRPPSESGSDGK